MDLSKNVKEQREMRFPMYEIHMYGRIYQRTLSVRKISPNTYYLLESCDFPCTH